MNSPDGLVGLAAEDRAEVERILDETLLTVRLTSGVDRSDIDRLRALALGALPTIASAADAEYRRYAWLREESRAGRPREADGAGAATVVFVLVPVLAAIAAVVFLLLGYVLGVTGSEPTIAQPMRQAGWVFAAVAGAGAVFAAAGLVVAAVRNGASTVPVPTDEPARAREEWHRALHDRGIAPFLREHAARVPEGRRAGASRTGFSSPRFSSPRFSSPAEGGADRDARR
ncbi:hypothetical protein [Streptomyces sp. NBC_01803]|uniref:hypothetical protein n=1 Tax=Streptomyces sp. NBC_01803 TaxID=2975946 RepID=UPI002DDB03B5|nr:hypothetical protein [Streptomyces sp. NBC_01803]WSA45347.1 hypothetical protein OIE51_14695 [Streptomyces sp. NBC_01803]